MAASSKVPDLAALKAAADSAHNAADDAVASYAAQTVAQQQQHWWSTTNAMTMSAIVLVFGLIVLGLATFLVRVGKSPSSVLRIFGTILIIVMATFLVVAGYDDKQIGAPLGLLGTLAGYLLGRETSSEKAG